MATDMADEVIERVREKIGKVKGFSANVALELDVDFIRMPTKYAAMAYHPPKEAKFDSEDFIVVPKRGLDFTYEDLFKYEYSSLYVGEEMVNDQKVHVVKIIPLENKSKVVLATLFIDQKTDQILRSEINTRSHGTYLIDMKFDQVKYNLPSEMVITFEMEKFNLPLKYLGKNVDVDKKKMKSEGPKTGRMILSFSDYKVEL